MTAVLRAVRFVAVANLTYFVVEFAVATTIGSMSLFADSIDFLEDAAVNVLILVGLAWSARSRARLGMVLALVLLLPSLATLWTAWSACLARVPLGRSHPAGGHRFRKRRPTPVARRR